MKNKIQMRPRNVLPKIQPSNQNLISETDFVPETFFNGLKDASLDQLAEQYSSINTQFQMMKGLILLAAREKLKSDKEFGKWVDSTHALCVDSQQVRNRYMNLARFFKSRPMTGISLTAAYEISKPDNTDIAETIYEKALNKNLKVSDVKKLIKEMKSPSDALSTQKKPAIDNEKLNQIFELVNGFNLGKDISIALLHACISKFKGISNDVIEGEVTEKN